MVIAAEESTPEQPLDEETKEYLEDHQEELEDEEEEEKDDKRVKNGAVLLTGKLETHK